MKHARYLLMCLLPRDRPWSRGDRPVRAAWRFDDLHHALEYGRAWVRNGHACVFVVRSGQPAHLTARRRS